MDRQKRAIGAYAVTATLVRSADAGAVVGFVLLAASSPDGSAVAGLLAAALTAPHLAGPLVAPLLDRSTRPRVVLAGSFLLYAAMVAVAALAFSHGGTALSVIALVIAGSCGPLITGGLSSRLAGLVGEGQVRQRRAQGMDALTYGVAAAFGPLLIAVTGAAVSPLAGVLAVCGAAVVATILLVTLPPMTSTSTDGAAAAEPVSIWRSAALLFTNGPLRRVTVCTSVTAVAVGAVPILAVASSAVHGFGGPSAAALLASAFGVGTLVGSATVIARPLRGSPERMVAGAASGIGLGLILCTIAPTLPLAAVAYAATGAVSAVQFASSLAARVEYSPPEARAQVFMTMAGLKVACSSAGVALAGLLVAPAPWALLLGAVLVVGGAAGATALDRFVAAPSS